jgi:glycerol uptake facilitator-like aquaporin
MKLLGESAGTFLIVFVGCSAVAADVITGGLFVQYDTDKDERVRGGDNRKDPS